MKLGWVITSVKTSHVSDGCATRAGRLKPVSALLNLVVI